MFVTSKQNGIDDSEVKLGLDILKSVVKVLVTDSDRVREFKESVSKIIMVLSYGDEEELLVCNKELTKRYRSVLLASGTGLIPLNEESMRQKSFDEKYRALLCIAQCLSREIKLDKCGHVLLDVAKAGLEYASREISKGGKL